ncbi:MAG: histidine kinase [Lachnospiraceae bacterium]|nr:histidine kinase [Lachnospiraceae bacterium]
MKRKNTEKKKAIGVMLFGAVIVLLWVVFYLLTIRIIRQNMERHAMSAVGTIMNDVGNELIMMEECSSILSVDESVKKLAASDYGVDFYDMGSAAQDVLAPVLKRVVNADNVIVYEPDGKFYRLKGDVPNTIAVRSFYIISEGKSDRMVSVSSGAENYVGIYRGIEDSNGITGYVLLLIDQRKIEKLLSTYNDPDYIGAALYYGDRLICAGGGIGKEEVESRLSEAIYVSERFVGFTGYRVVVYCVDSVSKDVSRFFIIALPVTVMIMLAVGFIFELFMRRFVRTSIDLELERTSLSLLKKQISAHFTVNTLNIVRALIGKGDKEAAARICTELSVLLRYANASDEYITLLEELYVLKQYIGIMQARYPGKISVIFCEDDLFSDILVPRMLLQPVVENAVMHGLSGEGGNLAIDARRDDGDLFITVSDDGKGMDAGELERVRGGMKAGEMPVHGSLDHIALVNIRKRIDVLFGEKYGMDIESDVSSGTVVTLHLPLILPGSEKNDSDFSSDVLSSDKKQSIIKSRRKVK